MCWKCGKQIDLSVKIYRSTVCPTCGQDLHSCKNCKFYVPGAHYDCHETIEEAVTDKDHGNFCDFFSPKISFEITSRVATQAQEAKDKFNKLFSL